MNSQVPPADDDRRIGLVAGWGRYPVVVAEALTAQGYRVYCQGIKEHADEAALGPICADFRWAGIAKMGRGIRYFRRKGIRQATMAGKIHKTKLFQPHLLINLVPDWRTFRALFLDTFILGRGDRRDDTLLGKVVAE